MNSFIFCIGKCINIKMWTFLESISYVIEKNMQPVAFLYASNHGDAKRCRSRLENNNRVKVMTRLRDFSCEHRHTSKAAIQQWDGS